MFLLPFFLVAGSMDSDETKVMWFGMSYSAKHQRTTFDYPTLLPSFVFLMFSLLCTIVAGRFLSYRVRDPLAPFDVQNLFFLFFSSISALVGFRFNE